MGKKTFWLLIIAMHAFAGIRQLCFTPAFTRDSEEYLSAAMNIRHHGTLYAGDRLLSINERLYTKRPVAYPAILAFFDLLSFGNAIVCIVLVFLVQNLLSLFNIWLIIRLLLKDNQKIPWGVLALLIVISPAQIIYANMLMSEIWLQSVIVLLCYMLIRHWGNFTYKNGLIIASLLIVGMLLKPVMAPLVFVFPLAALLYALRKKAYTVLLVSLLPLCAYIAYCGWNQQRTGYYHFSSISTINLLHYNTYGVLQKQYGTAAADSIIDDITAKAQSQGSFAAREQYIQKACKEMIVSNFGSYSLSHLKGMLLFFADPGRFDLVTFFSSNDTQSGFLEAGNTHTVSQQVRKLSPWLILVLALIAIGNLFKTAGLLVFSTRRNIPLYYRLLVLALILYICVLTGPIGASRFMMPLLPLLWLADIKALQQYKKYR